VSFSHGPHEQRERGPRLAASLTVACISYQDTTTGRTLGKFTRYVFSFAGKLDSAFHFLIVNLNYEVMQPNLI
jgi:hypothetical protein